MKGANEGLVQVCPHASEFARNLIRKIGALLDVLCHIEEARPEVGAVMVCIAAVDGIIRCGPSSVWQPPSVVERVCRHGLGARLCHHELEVAIEQALA